jgi:hypothetical protein
MRWLLIIILLLGIAYGTWQFAIPRLSPTLDAQSAHAESPPPLPLGRSVDDSISFLRIGNQMYYDVTVRHVFPDALSIVHREGASVVPLNQASSEIQTRYEYDAGKAKEIEQLRARHEAYNNRATVSDVGAESWQEQVSIRLKSAREWLASFSTKEAPPTEKTSTNEPQPTPTPSREEVLNQIGSAPISSENLAAICAEDPPLANRILKNRSVSVKGRIVRLQIRGIDMNDLSISLEGNGKFDVQFQTNYERYTKELKGMVFEKYRLTKEGPSLMRHSRSTNGSTMTSRLLVSEGDTVTLTGRVESVDTAGLRIHLPIVALTRISSK